MKIKPSQFRGIIKTAIKELIDEGAFNEALKESVREMISEGSLNVKDVVAEQAAIENGLIKNLQLEKTTMLMAQSMGRDAKTKKLFEDIYADTAKNTLQHQLSKETGGLGAAAALLTNEVSQEAVAADNAQLETFSASNRWAQVAFAKKSPGGN